MTFRPPRPPRNRAVADFVARRDPARQTGQDGVAPSRQSWGATLRCCRSLPFRCIVIMIGEAGDGDTVKGKAPSVMTQRTVLGTLHAVFRLSSARLHPIVRLVRLNGPCG
jgi:hypothetical protein